MWGTMVRLSFLLESQAPVGVDGYYYAVQMRSLLTSGSLYYPSAPLAFYWLLPFAWIFGPVTGVKLGAAIGTTLGAIPAYYLLRRMTGRLPEALLAAVLVATSAQGLLLSSEFVKQGISSTLLLVFLGALLAASSTGSAGIRKWIPVGAALISCALTHRAALGVALLFLSGFVLIATVSRTRKQLGPPRGVGRAMSTLGVACVLIVAGGGIGYRSLPEATRELLATLFSPATGRRWGELDWSLELWLAACCTFMIVLLVGIRWLRGHLLRGDSQLDFNLDWGLLAGPMLLSGGLCLPWVNQSGPNVLGPRLGLFGFVSLSMLAPVLLALLIRRARWAVRCVSVCFLIVLALCFAPRQNERQGISGAEPITPGLEVLSGRVSRDALIITTNHRISFQTTWVTDLHAQSSPPSSLEAGRAIRLLVAARPFPYQAEQGELIARARRFSSQPPHELPEILVDEGGKGWRLLAIPEPTWQAFLGSLGAEEKARLDPWSQSERPGGE